MAAKISSWMGTRSHLAGALRRPFTSEAQPIGKIDPFSKIALMQCVKAFLLSPKLLTLRTHTDHQGLSEHQKNSFTPVTKVLQSNKGT